MTDLDNEYLSTAKVARLLGLSIGTVQNLVTRGELQAVLTRGGHRRIFSNSVHNYRRQRGYIEQQPHGHTICIMQEAGDLDPAIMNQHGSQDIQLASHPFDLLGLQKKIDVLFIDARNSWLQTTPLELMAGLQKKYQVYIYNSDCLPTGSEYSQIYASHLIPQPLSVQFIFGYLTGRSAQTVH